MSKHYKHVPITCFRRHNPDRLSTLLQFSIQQVDDAWSTSKVSTLARRRSTLGQGVIAPNLGLVPNILVTGLQQLRNVRSVKTYWAKRHW